MITIAVMILFLIVFHNALFALAEMIVVGIIRLLSALLYIVTFGKKGSFGEDKNDY